MRTIDPYDDMGLAKPPPEYTTTINMTKLRDPKTGKFTKPPKPKK